METRVRAEEPNRNSRKNDEAEGKEFHARLLEIAAGYRTFGRFDRHIHFAPELCRGPSIAMSHSGDTDTHGKKLYYLLAKDPQNYIDGKEQKPGQVIVKEAWKAEPSKLGRGPTVVLNPDDKKYYRAGDQSDLFIMAKLDPDTPNTDEGWIYGTVSADGTKVTSAGRVESCMACHKSEKTIDRMFGVRVSEPGDDKR